MSIRRLVETVVACVLMYIFLFQKTAGKTLLMEVSALGYHRIVEVLLRRGCNPNALKVVNDLKITVLEIFIAVI